MRRYVFAFAVALAAGAAAGAAASVAPTVPAIDHRVAAAAAPTRPAIVVLWVPDCLACRKSLPEIERFAAGAAAVGVAVTTVVPIATYDEARGLLARRAPALRVESDAGLLPPADARALLDRPVAFAVDGHGQVVGTHAGLLGAWVLDALARRATASGSGAPLR